MSQNNSSSSSSCTTYNIGPNYVCNDHGICNLQGQCICNSGWTSRSDFQLGYYDDCDMSILFVQVGSIVLIVSATIAFVIGSWNIIHFRNFNASTLNLPKNMISVYYLLASIMGIIYGVFRFSGPVENIVGADIGSSFGMSGFMVFTFSGWALLSVIFADFLQSASRVFSAESRRKISDIDVTVKSLWWKIALVSLLIPVFVVVANVETQLADTMVICVIAICVFEVEVIAGMLVVVLGTFNTEFVKYVLCATDIPPVLAAIRFRTHILYYICVFFLVTVGPMMIVIAAIPYLRRKFTYVAIIFMIACIFPTIGVLIMLIKSKPYRSQQESSYILPKVFLQRKLSDSNKSLIYNIKSASMKLAPELSPAPKIAPVDEIETYSM